jgi:predicted membrane chloride channel (bestrophin family)
MAQPYGSTAPPALNNNCSIEDPEERTSFINSLNMVADEGDGCDDDDGERAVTYDPSSHLNVLFQLHGSVWPKVLPYCVCNSLFFILIVYLDTHIMEAEISVSSTGHSLTALLLAFLVIQRSGIVYAKYMGARHALEDMNRICGEVVQIACIYSKHDLSQAAENWRSHLAFNTILLLRTTVAALEFNSTNVNAWDILPEPSDAFRSSTNVGTASFSLQDTNDFMHETLQASDQDRMGHLVSQQWAHGKRTILNRNYKAPSVLAYRLRDTMLQCRTKVSPRMPLGEEMQIMNLIHAYVVDYHKLKAEVSTPFPFPFVQMARTFLFVWVFTIPFVMARGVENMPLTTFLVFFATYGFVGVELVSMELDDPYGDDPNDLDDVAFAQMTFEDIYICILKTDGMKAATKLRDTVKELAKRNVDKQRVREQQAKMAPSPSTSRRASTSSSRSLAKVNSSDEYTSLSGGTGSAAVSRPRFNLNRDKRLTKSHSVLGIY